MADGLYSRLGAMSMKAGTEFGWYGRSDLNGAFTKDIETLLNSFVKKYPGRGYSAHQLEALVGEFRVGVRETELKYLMIMRS